LAGMLHLQLILDCNWSENTTFSSVSLEVSLCWLPSGSGDIFLNSSAVCCPLLFDGVQMSIPPISEQAVSTPAGLRNVPHLRRQKVRRVSVQWVYLCASKPVSFQNYSAYFNDCFNNKTC
jgi:hypothetical protein